MNLVLHLTQTDGPGRVREFTNEVIRVGRDPDNDLVLTDGVVAPHHAEFRQAGEAWRIFDLNSTNGTYVNGQREQDAILYDGDVVEFGPRGQPIRVSLPGKLHPPSPPVRSPNQTSQSAEPTNIVPHSPPQKTAVWIGVGAIAGAIYSLVDGTPTAGSDPAHNLGRLTGGILVGALLGWLGGWLRKRRRAKRPGRTMPCASCGASLNAGVKFCSACGSAVPEACLNCGAALEHGTKFCPACATSVGASAPAVAGPIKWWRALGKTTLDRVFVVGTALFCLGLFESQLSFPLFKLGALGIGIYLFVKGHQKRGAGLAIASIVMMLVLSMVQGGQRSGDMSAPPERPRGAQGARNTTSRYKVVSSGAVSIQVPDDWELSTAKDAPSMTGSQRGYFIVGSPRGESIYLAALDWLDGAESEQRAFSMDPRWAQLAPKALPALPPVQAARAILSKSNDQSVTVIGVESVDPLIATLRYRHGKNEGFAASIVTTVTMEPTGIGWWTTVLYGAEAPVELFRQNAGIYAAHLFTIRVDSSGAEGQIDPERLKRIAQAPFGRMMQNDSRYQESMRRRTEVLGGNEPVTGPYGDTRVPIPDAPTSYCWQCPNRTIETGRVPTCSGAVRCRIPGY